MKDVAHARRLFLSILENPLDAASLRWVGDDAFEIISNDGLARHALSPSWDFRSSVKSLASPAGILTNRTRDADSAASFDSYPTTISSASAPQDSAQNDARFPTRFSC